MRSSSSLEKNSQRNQKRSRSQKENRLVSVLFQLYKDFKKREDAIKKAQEKKLVDCIIASGVTLDIPEEDKKQDDYNEESTNVVKAIGSFFLFSSVFKL